MPIMDKSLLFSDRQAITATAASTNLVDLGAARNFKGGEMVPITIAITESFNTLTSLTISVETDDNAAFSSATTVMTFPTITLTNLQAGDPQPPPYHIPWQVAERYLRLKYTVVGTDPTTGKITAGVSAGSQTA